MRSPRKLYIERIRELCSEEDRFIDMGAVVRVYRRGVNGKAEPGDVLPWGYGGIYDRLIGQYVEASKSPVEFKVHAGQAKFLETFDDPTCLRVLGLGAPGGGKTEGIVTVATLLCLWRPNGIGGMVAPTRDRLKILWNKFIKLVGPLGWIKPGDEGIRKGDLEIHLRNGTILQFVAAKKQSSATGSPIAGRDWHWAVEDEQQHIDEDALFEVDARGRIADGGLYRVFSSATNEGLVGFQMRVREYEDAPHKKVIRFTGPENVFTSLKYWEDLKAKTPPDEWRRKVECVDVPQEGRVYGGFTFDEQHSAGSSFKALPTQPHIGSLDITNRITLEKYQKPYDYIVGVDFGSLTTASVVLKAYQGRGQNEREWFAIHEIVTEDKTTDFHAKALLEYFRGDPGAFICIADPHEYKEVDRSDYTLFKKANINVVRASGGKIPQKHRHSVVNTLLLAADGRRRLFIAKGAPVPRLIAGLGHLMYDVMGNVQRPRQDRHHLGSDMSNTPDAMSFGLFPFEKHRGTFTPEPVNTKPFQASNRGGQWR